MFNHVNITLPNLDRETIDGVRYYKVPGNEEAIQLFKENEWKTVPQIFSSNGNHIGGYQDLKEVFDWPDNPAEKSAF